MSAPPPPLTIAKPRPTFLTIGSCPVCFEDGLLGVSVCAAGHQLCFNCATNTIKLALETFVRGVVKAEHVNVFCPCCVAAPPSAASPHVGVLPPSWVIPAAVQAAHAWGAQLADRAAARVTDEELAAFELVTAVSFRSARPETAPECATDHTFSKIHLDRARCFFRRFQRRKRPRCSTVVARAAAAAAAPARLPAAPLLRCACCAAPSCPAWRRWRLTL